MRKQNSGRLPFLCWAVIRPRPETRTVGLNYAVTIRSRTTGGHYLPQNGQRTSPRMRWRLRLARRAGTPRRVAAGCAPGQPASPRGGWRPGTAHVAPTCPGGSWRFCGNPWRVHSAYRASAKRILRRSRRVPRRPRPPKWQPGQIPERQLFSLGLSSESHLAPRRAVGCYRSHKRRISLLSARSGSCFGIRSAAHVRHPGRVGVFLK